MTGIGLLGILLSLAALPIVSKRLTSDRILLFLAMLGAHLAACAVFYLYVLNYVGDTTAYYYDSKGLVHWPFQFGTVFTVKLVQFLKSVIGGSYLDYFLLFQSFGVWGLALLMRVFNEVHERIGTAPTALSYGLLFLPSLHFWTTGIGKDAPLFFSVALAIWSVMQLRRRVIGFLLALLVMLLFRPHIALITAISLAMAAFFVRGTSALARLALLVFAAGGISYIAGTVESTFQIRFDSADSVVDWFARQAEISKQFDEGSAVLGAPFPVRLLSLMFRPFFFDAYGPLALIASFENVVLLCMFGFLAFHSRDLLKVARSAFFVQFALFFALALTILLALVYYNVGLGLRQRTMIMPALLTIFVVQWGLFVARRARAIPARDRSAARSASLPSVDAAE